jgi:hypothetical protein
MLTGDNLVLRRRARSPAAIRDVQFVERDGFVTLDEELNLIRHELSGQRFLDIPGIAPDRLLQVRLSSDGQTIAVGDPDGLITIWSASDASRRVRAQIPDSGVNCIAITTGARALLVGGQDGTIWIMQSDTGSRRLLSPKMASWVALLSVSPDERWLAASYGDGSLRLVECASGSRLQSLADLWASTIAFSPDSRTLITGLSNGTTRIDSLSAIIDALAQVRERDLDTLWALSGSPNAREAWAALVTLGARLEGLAFLELELVKVGAEKEVAQLIKSLDADEIEVRDGALDRLKQLLPHSQDLVCRALEEGPSAEAEVRLRLLDRLFDGPPYRSAVLLRHLRAIAWLEGQGAKRGGRILRRVLESSRSSVIRRSASAAVSRMYDR